MQVIDVPHLNQQPGNEYDIFCQLIKQYNVPEALRYKSTGQTCIMRLRCRHPTQAEAGACLVIMAAICSWVCLYLAAMD